MIILFVYTQYFFSIYSFLLHISLLHLCFVIQLFTLRKSILLVICIISSQLFIIMCHKRIMYAHQHAHVPLEHTKLRQYFLLHGHNKGVVRVRKDCGWFMKSETIHVKSICLLRVIIIVCKFHWIHSIDQHEKFYQ